jgi:hypothetical protein
MADSEDSVEKIVEWAKWCEAHPDEAANVLEEVLKAKRPKPPKIEVVILAKGVAQTGRYTRTVTVLSEKQSYRDNGKAFLLTEMDAESAETWAIDAINAAASNGLDIGNVPFSMAGMRAMGALSLGRLPRPALMDLLARMFTCVKILRNPTAAPDLAMALTPDDIQEAPTRILLRNAVFELHTDFLEPDAPSTSQMMTKGTPGYQGTPTSRQQSAPRSHLAR